MSRWIGGRILIKYASKLADCVGVNKGDLPCFVVADLPFADCVLGDESVYPFSVVGALCAEFQWSHFSLILSVNNIAKSSTVASWGISL